MQGKLLLSVSSLHLKSWCFQLSEHHPSELRELNTLRNNMVNQGSSCMWNGQHRLEHIGHLTHSDVQGTTYHEWQEPSKNAAAQNFTCQNNKGKKWNHFKPKNINVLIVNDHWNRTKDWFIIQVLPSHGKKKKNSWNNYTLLQSIDLTISNYRVCT